MFERIFACFLRLYPSRFRRDYEDEARQLLRERFRDETGLLRRLRLCLDLILDIAFGLPQAYWMTPKTTATAPVRQHVESNPSFRLLIDEKTHFGPFLVGSLLTLTALSLFSFVLSHEPPFRSHSGPNDRISPIEAVIQRLNQPLPASPTVQQRQIIASGQAKGTVPPQISTSSLPIAVKAPSLSHNEAEANKQQNVAHSVTYGYSGGFNLPLHGMGNLIVGAWQGTVSDSQQERRLVVQISEPHSGPLTVLCECAGKEKKLIKARSASFQNGVLKFTIPSTGARYKGKMASDGKSIVGTWEQGAISRPLLLNRVILRTPLHPAEQ